MKADLPCSHDVFRLLHVTVIQKVLRESYNTTEKACRLAKARGWTWLPLRTTDAIGGTLALGDRPDAIVG